MKAFIHAAWMALALAHPALADEFTDWRKNREARFPQVKAANPDPDAVIAVIKANTAAMSASTPRATCRRGYQIAGAIPMRELQRMAWQ